MLFAMVLAGGRSSRMGRDKALLELAGQSLLERSLALLMQAGADRIFISGQVAGHETVPDLHPHSGPPGGLLSTLRHIDQHFGLDASPLLVIPVDMPLLTPELLSGLVTALGDARAAHYQGEIFPCLFRARHDLLAHLEDLFVADREAGGKRSMKALLAFTESKEISRQGIADQLFLNVNRPEEWELVRGLAEAHGSPGL